MKVHELIAHLKSFPSDYEVHLDVDSGDDGCWEGDRVVRHVAGIRYQQGFMAVAIDAKPYEPITEPSVN